MSPWTKIGTTPIAAQPLVALPARRTAPPSSRPEMQRRQKSDDDNLEAGDQAVAGDPPGDHADKNKKADEQPFVDSYLV